LAGRSARAIAGGLAIVALLVLAWPGGEAAGRFPDSAGYLAWPEPVKAEGLVRLGPRLPAYPLLLRAVGTGPTLVHLQLGLCLTTFLWLGALLAGWPGLVLSGLLCLSPQLYVWQSLVLTESLTFSLLAGLVAGGVWMARRPGPGALLCWLGAMAFFGLLRSSNVLIVPFLLAPMLLWWRDPESRHGWRPALGGQGRWLWVAIAATAAVVLLGTALSERSGFWRMNYVTAMMERVAGNPQAIAWFGARGMPTPIVWKSDAFAQWLESDGRGAYQSWVVGRADAYALAWTWLRPSGQRAEIERRYLRPGAPQPSWGAEAGAWLYAATGPPQWIWLGVLVGAVGLALWRGVAPEWALSAGGLALGAYLQSFVTYHASGAEEVRHTLGAALMYRLCFVASLRVIGAAGAERWASMRAPAD
jgi:hypothetical protein